MNLAKDPAYASTLADLRGRLASRVKSLPDLSFYPESYLVESAFDDPSGFGQSHQQEIASLVDIADLSLMPFEKARVQIESALNSDDPWQRYWGLITCSSHGVNAAPLVATAKALAANDSERLVRVRAAEFLGLIEAEDPRETIMEALRSANSAVEANLILNTLVLLRDGQPSYDFEVTGETFKFPETEMEEVNRRLEYLTQPGP